MRIATPAIILAAFSLAACASTPDAASLGPVDDNGFVARAGQDIYHVKSGLYCPSEVGGMLRDTVTVFRPDIDIACNYKSARQEMTVYLYPDATPVDDAMAGVIDAASRGNLGNRVRPSDPLTQTCKTQAVARSIVRQTIGKVRDGDKNLEITLDTHGGSADFPYRVGALEGGGARSYAALVPRANGQMLKLRYSAWVSENDNGPEQECSLLYNAADRLYRSIGRPDGAEPTNDVALADLLSTTATDTES